MLSIEDKLRSETFYGMRCLCDSLSFDEYKSSDPGFTRDRFTSLHDIAPDASSFLELGAGTGYILRVALKLGYDAVGVECSDNLINISKKSLEKFGYETGRVLKGDFLSDDFPHIDLRGRKLRDYDIVHLWTIEKVVFDALPKIIPQMKKGAVLITGFEQPFFSDDISDHLVRKNIPADVQGYSRGTFFLKRH